MRLHASCVAVQGKAALLTGASGSGKSALALQLMALGARLVADDQTDIAAADGRLLARAPASIRGLIEMRGLGLLNADAVDDVPVAVVVDMAALSTARLPADQTIELCGCALPLLHKVESAAFAAGLMQYLKGGKADR
ncbi:HPr kinase/phosphorylase [Candidatus Rhodobacter oscarellae]|uniref:HPr kinase/phosphorylase n=1 Tax=Candidatus Rhodobacter oscarellae TaxID=1675527 RepID=A0A0J9EFV5_9RHOB|nr:HPr kinase/phosphatase C-terminal domain-containing protein [Candidatus Rhodobacter lobularis]KMW60574.1 HPr kinase/phosphorylase [Candidatus Rhodobacter lobularis]